MTTSATPNPDVTTDSHPESEFDVTRARNFARLKRWRLIWLLVFSFAIGLTEQLLAEDGLDKLFEVGGAFARIILITSWCQVDACERDFTIGKLLFVTIVFVTFIGLPAYLIRTRGVRGVLSSLLALLFAIIMAALELIAIEITYALM